MASSCTPHAHSRKAHGASPMRVASQAYCARSRFCSSAVSTFCGYFSHQTCPECTASLQKTPCGRDGCICEAGYMPMGFPAQAPPSVEAVVMLTTSLRVLRSAPSRAGLFPEAQPEVLRCLQWAAQCSEPSAGLSPKGPCFSLCSSQNSTSRSWRRFRSRRTTPVANYAPTTESALHVQCVIVKDTTT